MCIRDRSCGDALTDWTFGPGESNTQTLEGGLLDSGIYVATANFDMVSSLAYASRTIEVE